ncbi:MAG: hypothetical protein RI907_2715 [Pseudomonadota bacterium]|jgi:filamentous hemagglutinin family protein
MSRFVSRSSSPARRRAAPGSLKPLLLALSLAGLGSVAQAAGPTVADTQLPNMTLVRGTVDTARSAVGTEGSAVFTDASRAVDSNGVLTMTIQQTSSKAVWQASDFSVGARAAFVNNGPSAGTDTLIHVTGGSASGIYGSVVANNRLWLVNASGIYVGSTGSVSAASLMMSARDIVAAEVEGNYEGFVKGDPLRLAVGAGSNDFGSGGYIDIAREAIVSARQGVVLVAPKLIHNAGTVSSTDGARVSMLVANDAVVQVGDSGYLTLGALTETATNNSSQLSRVIYNEGTVQADNGHIDLLVAGSGNSGTFISAGVNQEGEFVYGLTNRGQVRAQSTDGSSTIDLTVMGNFGSNGARLSQFGSVNASGTGGASSKGGTITLSSSDTRLYSGSEVRADGGALGGTITLAPATRLDPSHSLSVDEGATVSASASAGQGGQVRVVADSINLNGTIQADGSAGGGQVHLVARPTADSSFLVGPSGVLSADATANGNGGLVRLLLDPNVPQASGGATAAADTATTLVSGERTAGFSSLSMLGTARARGGEQGGQGGQVVASAQIVQLRQAGEGSDLVANIDTRARAAAGTVGQISLYSPFILVGNPTELRGADYGQVTQLDQRELNSWLSVGTNVRLGAVRMSPQFESSNGADVRVLSGTVVEAASARNQTLTLEAADSVRIGDNGSGQFAYDSVAARIGVGEGGGKLNLTLRADTGRTGQGEVVLVGYDTTAAAAAPGRATAKGANSQSPSIQIRTNGGDIEILGSTAAQGETANGQAVYVEGSSLNAGAGSVTLRGGLHDGWASRIFRRGGVKLYNSDVTARNVTLDGKGLNLAGVEIYDVTLNVQGGALVAKGVAVASGESSATGVSAEYVTVNLDGARSAWMGRADASTSGDGTGLLANSVDFVTKGSYNTANGPQVVLVGSSTGSNAPGLDLSNVTLRAENTDVRSDADLMLGASSTSAQGAGAIYLGFGNQFLTSGRVGVRPIEFVNGQLVDQVNTAIGIGFRNPTSEAMVPTQAQPKAATTESHNTNFQLPTALFDGNMGENLNIIVGSNKHVGAIVVADQVFNGSTVTTLQNQGANAGGIVLGSQGGVVQNLSGRSRALAAEVPTAGTLNLLTSGNVSQGGAITADAVNVVVGPQSSVALNNPDNKIGSLLVSGGNNVNVVTQGARPSSVATVAAYNADSNSFEYLSVSNSSNQAAAQEQITPSVVSVESTDVLNDTRTDVYVRGQFNRPQVCTPANTAGGSVEVLADMLAQQWLQVRRSAQLSTCSSVRNDSNCSAF